MFTNDIEHLYLEILFAEKAVIDPVKILTSKQKPAILNEGFYYNHQRDNLKSIVFKCRQRIKDSSTQKDKECTSSFTLNHDGSWHILAKHTTIKLMVK